MNYDFEGYATKHGIRCSDGAIIRDKAFAHLDGKQVPLLWNHAHDDPDSVLGHVLLENREDGIYCFGSFNDTPKANTVKMQLEHGDYNALSIYANQIAKEGNEVVHGQIREVSVVLAGANPGAVIDRVSIQHADGSFTDSDDSFVMHMDAENCMLMHSEQEEADEEPLTQEEMQEIYDGMSDEEKAVMGMVVGAALADKEEKTEPKTEPKTETAQETKTIEHGGSKNMKTNVFSKDADTKSEIKHSENIRALAHSVWSDVKKGASFKDSFIKHAQDYEDLKDEVIQHDGYEYGIKNIEILFPDAKTSQAHPDFLKRNTGWVSTFIGKTKKNPFTRLKMRHADLTADEARAKGYITGNRKMEEVFDILQRTTEPTTIYKKQKLDRDNILDVTDFDIVSWMWGEMRIMLDEEIAVAALLGDGRSPIVDGKPNPDKINELCIRPIYKEDELYAHRVMVQGDPAYPGGQGSQQFIDEIIRTRKFYKGSGLPDMFTTSDIISEMLLLKDSQGRYLYETIENIKSKLRVANIYEVEQMEGIYREDETHGKLMLGAVIVNPSDYEMGTDKGGQITSFNQFDIDYNQEKMLLETRMSGSLTKAKTALIYEFMPWQEDSKYKHDYYKGKDALKDKPAEEDGSEVVGG